VVVEPGVTALAAEAGDCAAEGAGGCVVWATAEQQNNVNANNSAIIFLGNISGALNIIVWEN
jgi:hypothetical protein